MTIKKKYIFPMLGLFILISLVGIVFYVLFYSKDVFQAAVGEAGGEKAPSVQFDFKRASVLVPPAQQ